MHDDKAKKIGSATYLNKSIGPYIPFKLRMDGTNCKLIKPMLDKSIQYFYYINKDNKEYYTCEYKYLECS